MIDTRSFPPRRRRIAGIVIAAGVGLSLGLASAGDEPARPDAALEYWKKAAQGYRIELETIPPRPLTFHEEPVLKWTNPERKTDSGAVFVWTDRGRPEVVASFYRFRRDGANIEDHEFMSLATETMIARVDGASVWSPTLGGILVKPIPDAPAPAASAPERLRQMRALARDFKAFFNNPPDLSEIRLLTQPLYRYELNPSRAEVLDGALFAFVHATDPEVLLLIEARPVSRGGFMAWHYAIARMSVVNLRVLHNDHEVWSASWDTDPENPSKPYMTRRDVARGH